MQWTFCAPAFSVAVLAWLAVPGLASAGVERFEGYAYAAGDGSLLYRESHWKYMEGDAEAELILYRCGDGQPFARKHVDRRPGSSVPDFEMLDGRTGYRDGVRTREGHREVFEQVDSKAPERSARLEIPRNAVIDAGLHGFVRAQWEALSGAGVSPVPILVASRLGYLNFSARKLRDEGAGEREVRWFRLSLDNFLGFALPHIDVGYDSRTHELRAYEGLTDISGNGHRNLHVKIDYPLAERHADATPAEVQQAAAVPLTARCLMP